MTLLFLSFLVMKRWISLSNDVVAVRLGIGWGYTGGRVHSVSKTGSD